MYAALIKNKWPLLAFVAIVLAGAQYFVGYWGDGPFGRSDELAAPPPEQPVEAEPVVEMPQPDLAGFYDGIEYVSDDELVDEADGFDPTPVEEEEEPREGVTKTGDPIPRPEDEFNPEEEIVEEEYWDE